MAVADSKQPGPLSVEVSQAVFESAPVVVIASAADAADVRVGADRAGELGAPLLLLDGTAEALPESLVAEVSRLRAEGVLAVGTTTATRLGPLEVPVETDPAKLPQVAPIPPAPDLAVLAREGSAGSSARAQIAGAIASAAATAAGGKVVDVATKDFRADPAAIRAIADQQPRRVLAVGTGFGSAPTLARRVTVAKTGAQLPGGGQVLFPGRRLVALYGHPDAPVLGVLGEQDIQASIARAKKMAKRYQPYSSVPVVPTFEIIATVLRGSPGRDGDYSSESTVKFLRPWVEAAGKAGVYVVLDLQPGRTDFLTQAKLYTDLLRLPHVGLALDPEWRLHGSERPLRSIGHVDAKEINQVTAWLADLTAREKLPQKLLVLHQFQLQMIRDERKLDLDHDEVQVLIHMDGQGGPDLKQGTWQAVTDAAPKGVPFGWKNFYDEDPQILSPKQTMAKKPTPRMVSYQ